jgi:hypothetical protein
VCVPSMHATDHSREFYKVWYGMCYSTCCKVRCVFRGTVHVAIRCLLQNLVSVQYNTCYKTVRHKMLHIRDIPTEVYQPKDYCSVSCALTQPKPGCGQSGRTEVHQPVNKFVMCPDLT